MSTGELSEVEVTEVVYAPPGPPRKRIRRKYTEVEEVEVQE